MRSIATMALVVGTIASLVSVSLVSCDKKTEPAPDTTPSAPTTASKSDATEAASVRLVNDVHVHLNFGAYKSFLDMARDLNLVRAANMSGGFGATPVSAHLALPSQVRNRIAPFMNMNWDGVDEPGFGEKRARDLEIAVEHGYAGLKISKALGLGVKVDGELMAVDDPRLDPIFATAGRLGVPVAIHTGDPAAFFEPPGPENERNDELSMAPSWSFHGDEYPSRDELLAARDRLVKRHSKTRFILVHFANNPEDLDYVDHVLNENDNVVVDLSARIAEIGRHSPQRVRDLFSAHANRILFGSDLQYSLGKRPDGNVAYRLTLGSISKEPRRFEHVPAFYDAHYAYLEGDGDDGPIDHPIPIQGDWKVEPIGLGDGQLRAIYWGNSEALIFAPWLGRTMAHDRVRRARDIAGATE